MFAPGLFAGTLVATGSKHAVVAKSPLTGMIGDSLSGSFWSHTLRRAGYDALVISGRAESPVYLSISDDQVRIRKAGHLMGLDTFATEDAVRRELGSDEFSVSAIGPAGERMVRFALHRQRPRTHGGPHGPRRGDGLQEPEGDRRARQQDDPHRRHGRARAAGDGSRPPLPGADDGEIPRPGHRQQRARLRLPGHAADAQLPAGHLRGRREDQRRGAQSPLCRASGRLLRVPGGVRTPGRGARRPARWRAVPHRL